MMNFSKYAGRLKFRLGWIITLLVLLRIFILYLNLNNQGLMYMASQTVFTISWAAVGIFMFQCSFLFLEDAFEVYDLESMKNTSFFAMLACLARVVVYAIYKWPMISYNRDANVIYMWPTIHNLLEQLVWLLLAVFFFYYWMARRKQVKRTE